jgi:hypothetical protein
MTVDRTGTGAYTQDLRAAAIRGGQAVNRLLSRGQSRLPTSQAERFKNTFEPNEVCPALHLEFRGTFSSGRLFWLVVVIGRSEAYLERRHYPYDTMVIPGFSGGPHKPQLRTILAPETDEHRTIERQ